MKINDMENWTDEEFSDYVTWCTSSYLLYDDYENDNDYEDDNKTTQEAKE